jgi:hypothetical protein
MESSSDRKIQDSSISAEAKPLYRSVQTQDEPTILSTKLGFANSKSNTEVQTRDTSWEWNVIDAEPQPFYYDLIRPVDLPYTSPDIVGDRICHSLRKRSVVAVYSGSEARCKTSDFLKYKINLYALGDDGTRMEIILMSGCGFAFRTEREAVINAAKGCGSIFPSNLPFKMKIPENMLQNYKPPSEKEDEDVLSRAVDKLHSSQRDVQLFILEDLSIITNQDKVNRDAALQMSNLILKNTFDICDIMIAMISSCFKESDESSCRIIHLCFTIFSNIMTLLSEEEELAGIMMKNNKLLADQLFPSLVDHVKECKKRCPHTTSIVLKCICLLVQNSPAARKYVTEQICEFVKEAISVGKVRHSRLEEEGKATLAALEV